MIQWIYHAKTIFLYIYIYIYIYIYMHIAEREREKDREREGEGGWKIDMSQQAQPMITYVYLSE